MTDDSLSIPILGAFLDDADIARNDLADYRRLLLQPNDFDSCLAIERAWGLDGLPPFSVMAILERVANGEDLDEAAKTEMGIH